MLNLVNRNIKPIWFNNSPTNSKKHLFLRVKLLKLDNQATILGFYLIFDEKNRNSSKKLERLDKIID